MALDENVHAQLAAAGTSSISDVMERLALRRTAITGFRHVAPDTAATVGTALTIRQVPKSGPADRAVRLVRHDEISKHLAQPGDFVVVDSGGRTDVASWGGNHSARCHARGVSGVLINGATRDLAEIRRLGFPTFHLGTSPVASRWDQETAEINGPVTLAGVRIVPGDIIVGDEDGLIVIAPAQLAAVVSELRRSTGDSST